MPKDGIGARFYNIEWILGPDPNWSKTRAYVLTDGSSISGFAPFYRQTRPLVLHLGEVAIASARLTRFTLLGDLHYSSGVSRHSQLGATAALLDSVVHFLSAGEALYFEGLPVDGVTHDLLAGELAHTLGVVTIPLGPPFDHQFIDFPASFKDYALQLGASSRHSVQYSARRLVKEMAGQVDVRRFDSIDDVEQFLSDAAEISRKTYQSTLLGLGIRADSATRRRLQYAAARGWLRSYILYCKSVPSAFMLGFEYGGCYYYDDVGYDPAYAKWSVGTVLQLKVIEEILGSPNPPRYFDFSTGSGQHKVRFGNMERREANILVLPGTARTRALALAYRGVDRLSRSAAHALDSLGIKNRLKKFIRRWTHG